MEKEKTIKLIEKWAPTGRPYSYDTAFVRNFVDWLYAKGFTVETRFQGEDLKKQEELIGQENTDSSS